MINISKLTKSCAWVAGLAIVGYLGYHLVRWIINKCSDSQKVDEVAHTHLPKSPIRTCKDLEISSDKINLGYGEYVVFQNPQGKDKKVSQETYEKVYQVFDRYSPANIVNHASEHPDIPVEEQCAKRYETLREKVKEIDPSLEIAFIPRTLYDLFFIQQTIKEDLSLKKICCYTDKKYHTRTAEDMGGEDKLKNYQDKMKKTQAESQCWHLCYFDDAGDNQHAGVKDVAYRLNQVIVEALSPVPGGLTYEQLAKHTELHIDYLKDQYKAGSEEMAKIQKGQKVESISNCNHPGFTSNFRYESRRGKMFPMGIRDDKDAQMIRNAVALECSAVAQKSFLLYRGADFQKDAPFSWKTPDDAFSLSYGSSLFAGGLYAGDDTPYYYMRNGSDGYAVSVPFSRLNDSPFYIPHTNAVSQIFGNGELFHPRTKGWKDTDGLGGIWHALIDGTEEEQKQKKKHLMSDLGREEFVAQFQEFKDQAIQLK